MSKRSKKAKAARRAAKSTRPPKSKADSSKSSAGSSKAEPARSLKSSKPKVGSKPISGLRFGWKSALAANLLIIGVWLYSVVVREMSADFFYLSSQEDEYLEWSTFWAFMLAGFVTFLAAYYQRRRGVQLPWFLAGLGVFCVVVAMEEISWGQRVLGYRPPTYFLENNFQLELNVHNVMSTDMRKLVLKAVILGYGVVLPLLGLFDSTRRLASKFAVVLPPFALIPSFIATFLYYEIYPWSFTGEWIELMLGLGFLFTAIATLLVLRTEETPSFWNGPSSRVTAIVASMVFVVVLGLGNAAISRSARSASPALIEAARGELEALRRDFSSGRIEMRCGRHRRIHTYKKRYRQSYLEKGAFAGLTAQGLPEERAQFFLDPWNSPYWVRDRCKRDGSRRVIFVYSFGPNRKRDSEKWEILGDDVGLMIYDGRVKEFGRKPR